MTARTYAGAAVNTTINPGITASSTMVGILDATGWPTANFWASIDPDGTEEKIFVVTRTGLTLDLVTTANRGKDGTASAIHASGVKIIHCATAQDFQDANDHENAVSGVHGIVGDVVGTTDAQILSNKTLNSPIFTGTPSGLFVPYANGIKIGETVAQSLSPATAQTINFDNTIRSAGAAVGARVGNQIKIWATGLYDVRANIEWGFAGSGTGYHYLVVNSPAGQIALSSVPSISGAFITSQSSTLVLLNQNDLVSATAWNESNITNQFGGDGTLETAQTYLEIHQVA